MRLSRGKLNVAAVEMELPPVPVSKNKFKLAINSYIQQSFKNGNENIKIDLKCIDGLLNSYIEIQ